MLLAEGRITQGLKAESRVSVKIQQKGPREMATDFLGSFVSENDAPSSQTTKTPSELTKGCVGPSGSTANSSHLKLMDESATPKTDEFELDYCDFPASEASRTAIASIESRRRAPASG